MPGSDERQLHEEVNRYLRQRAPARACAARHRPRRAEEAPRRGGLSRLQIRSILNALGSHPAAVAGTLEKLAATDPDGRTVAATGRPDHVFGER